MLKAAAWLASVLMTCWHFSSLEGSAVASGKATLNQAQTISKTSSRLSNAVLKDGQLPFGTREEGILKPNTPWISSLGVQISTPVNALKENIPVFVKVENPVHLPPLAEKFVGSLYRVGASQETAALDYSKNFTFNIPLPEGETSDSVTPVILFPKWLISSETTENSSDQPIWLKSFPSRFIENGKTLSFGIDFLVSEADGALVFGFIKKNVQTPLNSEQLPFGTREEGILKPNTPWISSLGVQITTPPNSLTENIPVFVKVENPANLPPYSRPLVGTLFRVGAIQDTTTLDGKNTFLFSVPLPDGETIETVIPIALHPSWTFSDTTSTTPIWLISGRFDQSGKYAVFSNTFLISEQDKAVVFGFIRR